MSKVERIRVLDNVKWILTLLIVLYHISYYGNGGVEETVFYFLKNLGDCVVPAFAIISGFLFWKDIRDISDLKSKCKRRVFTLLIPYVLWNLINTIALNILKSREIEEIFNVNIWNQIVKWESSPHFWYIFMLIFWTVLAPILYVSYKDKRCLALLLLSQVIYLIYKGDGIYHSRFIYIIYTWGGYIGYIAPDILSKLTSLKGRRKAVLSIGAILLHLLLCIVISMVDIQMGIKVWVYSIKAITLIIFAIYLPPLKIGQMTNFKFSFWVFVVHYWLDHYVGIYASRYLEGLIHQGMVWLIVVAIALISGMAFDKLCPRIFGILNGSRNNRR